MHLRSLVAASLLASLGCTHAATTPRPAGSSPAAAPQGIEAFTRHSRYVDAKLSPKGTYLAAVILEKGKRALAVVDLKTRKLASTFNPFPESVGRFYWANDGRILVELLYETDGYLAQPVYTGEIWSLDAANGRGHMLYGYDPMRVRGAHVWSTVSRAWGRVLSRIDGDDQHVLIEAGDWDGKPTSLLRLHADTGVPTEIIKAPLVDTSFIIDESGEPRIAIGARENLRARYFYREKGSSWSELSGLKGIGLAATPLEFESGAHVLDLAEPVEKGFGVFALDIDSGTKKLLSQNEWVGPSHFLEDRHQRLLAVEYDPDLPTWDFIVPDHPLSRALKGLLAAYPDENVRILNTTDDEKRAVALVSGDRDPGRFLLLDVDKSSAEEIVAERPWVDPAAMAEMTAFHIRARDGLWLHGYVTLPKAAKPGVPPPLIVLPHGGPHGVRDSWGYNPEVQLLASEGFAVLQVNYRGSGGYTVGFQEAGYKHWGDRMIEDIVDATRYAINKGYGDGRRVCIYGASYGAYAALQSTIVAPELFRCAVGYAGIYDLTLMAKVGDSASDQAKDFRKVAIGTDPAELKRQSPAYNAEKVKAKVLLIHGKLDHRAPIEHAEHMKQALEKAGNAPEWLVEPHEAHGFYDDAARERAYTRIVSFLQENDK
jgi:dienelactone hydrolase